MIFMVEEKRATGSSELLVYHKNICELWKKTDELINSMFPKFPHILCFSEDHLKQLELDQMLHTVGSLY
jgi:hypothetical protein